MNNNTLIQKLWLKKIVVLLLCNMLSSLSIAQPGANDPTFNPSDIGFGIGDGANAGVGTIAIQSDGKIIIGGGSLSSMVLQETVSPA